MLHKDITLATRMANKGLSPMDLSGSASQTPEKWWKQKRAFKYYAEGEGIDSAYKKTSQLLHFAILESGDNAFKITIRKLDSYFRAEENIPYEHHVFRQLALKEEENADQFMFRLRRQA